MLGETTTRIQKLSIWNITTMIPPKEILSILVCCSSSSGFDGFIICRWVGKEEFNSGNDDDLKPALLGI